MYSMKDNKHGEIVGLGSDLPLQEINKELLEHLVQFPCSTESVRTLEVYANQQNINSAHRKYFVYLTRHRLFAEVQVDWQRTSNSLQETTSCGFSTKLLKPVSYE